MNIISTTRFDFYKLFSSAYYKSKTFNPQVNAEQCLSCCVVLHHTNLSCLWVVFSIPRITDNSQNNKDKNKITYKIT
jgi:hypothetical protein